MYCQKCGTEVQENATFCSKCGTQIAIAKPPSEVGERVKTASKDAMQAIKVFAANPVGGLPAAFENLDEARAIGVGIAFAVVFVFCVFAGVYMILPAWSRPSDIGSFFKVLIFGAVPFVSIVGASALARKIFGGAGSFGGDSFIAGASLLPFGFLVLLGGILGIGNFEIIAFLSVFALCYTILMLYTGSTRISKISESRAALAVPIMVIVSGWLTKVLYTAMLPTGSFPSY